MLASLKLANRRLASASISTLKHTTLPLLLLRRAPPTPYASARFLATRGGGGGRRPPSRRTRPAGGRGDGPPSSSAAAAPAAASSESIRPLLHPSQPLDPHQMAAEAIASSSDKRIPGTEAIASLTPEQKMRNYGLATALVGFVTFVWWYSIQAVGKSEVGGLEELRAEAEEARVVSERRKEEERKTEELVGLELTMGSLDEKGDVGIVAIAAPEEVARLEEEEQRRAGGKAGEGGGGRPLWKKVVFFWRRE